MYRDLEECCDSHEVNISVGIGEPGSGFLLVAVAGCAGYFTGTHAGYS